MGSYNSFNPDEWADSMNRILYGTTMFNTYGASSLNIYPSSVCESCGKPEFYLYSTFFIKELCESCRKEFDAEFRNAYLFAHRGADKCEKCFKHINACACPDMKAAKELL